MYPSLCELVNGKVVAVVGGNASIENPENYDHVIRFNNDKRPASIWATTFADDRAALVHPSSRFVIVTVPVEDVNVWMPYPFNSEFRDHTFARLRMARVALEHEIVDVNHWMQLAAAMPILPLSGMVAIAMLQMTTVKRVDLIGFDYYSREPLGKFLGKSNLEIYPRPPYCQYHDYDTAISWLSRLMVSDSRFVWCGSTSLTGIAHIWNRRMRFLRGVHLARRVRSRVVRAFS